MGFDLEHYQSLYTDGHGHFRAPFANIALYKALHNAKTSTAEARAIINSKHFIKSFVIILRRLRRHLRKVTPTSIAAVRFDELFVDAQSLFLFVQQFFEDVARIIKLGFPRGERMQLNDKFSKLAKALRAKLPHESPLKLFLDQEHAWFKELKDIRDDISHRTSADRTSREATFPELHELMAATAGARTFPSAADFRSYLQESIARILAFAAIVDDFLREKMERVTPNDPLLKAPAIIYERSVHPRKSSFIDLMPGTVLVGLGGGAKETLNFFLKPKLSAVAIPRSRGGTVS